MGKLFHFLCAFLFLANAGHAGNPDHICQQCEAPGTNCELRAAIQPDRDAPTCRGNQTASICHSSWCGGGGSRSPGGTSANCNGAANCTGRAGETQRDGISDLQSLNRETRGSATQMKELQADHLDYANAILNKWNKSLASGSEKGGNRENWKRDRDLVDQATRNYDGKGNFPASMANKAHEPGIRRELSGFVQAKSMEQALKDQEAENNRAIQKLMAMNSKTNERKNDLKDLSPLSNAVKSATASSDFEWKFGEGKSSEASPGKPAPPEESTITSSDAEKIAAAKKLDRNPSSLRDQLRAKLAAKLKGSSSGLDVSKAEVITAGAAAPGEKGGAATSAVSEILADGGSGKSAFSMNSSETDKEVKHLMAQLEGDSLRSDGVLSGESMDLFRRVHLAHENCERRDCVQPGARP